MAEYVINLLGNVCELFIILFFLKDNYKPRVKKAVFIPLCIVFTLFQFVNTNLFLKESPLVVLGSLIFIFLVMLLYNIKRMYRILFSLFIFILNVVSESIVGMTLSAVFDISISFAQRSSIVFAICTLTSKFLAYSLILLTKSKRFYIKDKPIKHSVLWVFLLPVASVLIMLLFLRCCYEINDNWFHVLTLISFVVLAFANIAIFYIIDKQNVLIETKEKLLFTEKHINNQIVHYQELYKHQNELRVFRHDIKNRLLSLMAMLKDGGADKALQTMERNLNWLEEMNNNIVNSGNPIVDAVIQSKLYLANEKNISLRISTKLAEKIRIDELELGIALGNALDNALEAVDRNIDEDKKYISFIMMSADDRISISLSNPVEEDIDTEKLMTSKADRKNHGYGTRSIKAIAQRYDGFADFTCEDKIFTVNINIRNIEPKE